MDGGHDSASARGVAPPRHVRRGGSNAPAHAECRTRIGHVCVQSSEQWCDTRGLRSLALAPRLDFCRCIVCRIVCRIESYIGSRSRWQSGRWSG